ncbi:hypothetical protein PSEUBRA_003871 [Kalmanozyma brasiliensis GHG001]|uniref:Mediator of RNA polymerase II transcription subunit 19 n=1 Tax=Kalmanozyma brasiliensis (strain GHG001) TaxID=1365824 RepID=V5ESS9_KALBG|nr:uncharacterized protein PSEUBRA_003871 [Kalmanozyma brasiliensis GHG001]EST06018.1 hypothetical protein PSEUBRA_003871 [Kalmanozyma brasiliensis GHG001]
MSADVAAVKREERAMVDDSDINVASSSNSANRPPPYLPATTSKPADLPRAYLNGTQDMLSLFGLMPIYDRAVRPYNPETIKAENEASTSSFAAPAGPGATPRGGAQTGNAAIVAGMTGEGGAANAGSVPPGATPSSSQQGLAQGNATPRPSNAPTVGAAGLASHPSHAASSTGRISTPALQLNGGPPTFSLHTDSSAILAASPGQLAASAAAAPPARKPTKPPGTYAHYVEDLAGRVRPPRKSARAAREGKGTTLTSILFKPEYTPQRIVPFDRETMQAAFSVEPGVVAQIDQALLEPDDEEVRPRKKKKKDRVKDEVRGMRGSSGVSSAARTPVRR